MQLLTTRWPMPSLSPSSRPPTPASHPYIFFSMTSDGMEYPFGQFLTGTRTGAQREREACSIPGAAEV